MKHLLRVLFVLLLYSSRVVYAESIPIKVNQVCLTQQEYDEVVSQFEKLIKTNDELLSKIKQLEAIQKATPEMQLEPLVITVDRDGRVFAKEKLIGKLKISDLSYDVSMKLNTVVVRMPKPEYGFDLRLKAGIIQNYERQRTDEQGNVDIKSYTSGALVVEPFHYKYINANIVVGPRLYGPALGVDITEHFDGLVGLGFLYNNDKTFFMGASFDF
jgi:hypothetical protein